MISYNEAVNIVRHYGEAHRLASESVALEQIAGRICAAEVRTPMANQPFDNSAMDGYALASSELAGASSESPRILAVAGRIAAGQALLQEAPAEGQCYEIMTGAPLPAGCDTVVPVENTERQGDRVVFWAPSPPGNHVRYVGEDFALDESLFRVGSRLEVAHILPLATLGVSRLEVLRKPRVAILSTGLEVIDDLDQPLQSGQIYNATAPYLRQMLPAFGAEAMFFGTVTDEPEIFRAKLRAMMASEPDILVTTGAVSAGVYDFIRAELEALGADVLFHKVRVRPGKPILFAKLPGNGPVFVGLPGNPVATAAGLRFFVYPLIRAMQGLPPEAPKPALLKSGSHSKKSDFRLFLRAVAREGGQAAREVEILPKQQSFMVSTFIPANGWVVAPEGVENISVGDTVDFYPHLPDS